MCCTNPQCQTAAGCQCPQMREAPVGAIGNHTVYAQMPQPPDGCTSGYAQDTARPRGEGFGWALKQLHNGSKVARVGWNGKSMWIALTPSSVIIPEFAKAGAAEHLAREIVLADFDEREENKPKRCITINAHIDMKTVDGRLQVGWVASQADMLATDWVVVE